MTTTIARWESKTRRWYCDLGSYGDGGYSVGYDGGGGVLYAACDAEAIATVQARYIDTGMCQPDANTTPMVRVSLSVPPGWFHCQNCDAVAPTEEQHNCTT